MCGRGSSSGRSITIRCSYQSAADNQKTIITVRYQNWQRQIELTGRQVYLCQFDLSVITGNEALTASQVRLFPNPSAGYLTIEWPGTLNKSVDISVMNASGQLVCQQKLSGNPSTGSTQSGTLSVANLPSGLYLVRLSVGNKQITRRIFKN